MIKQRTICVEPCNVTGRDLICGERDRFPDHHTVTQISGLLNECIVLK